MAIQMVKNNRETLYLRSNCRFVEPDEFCDLLVSRHPFLRADESAASARGLLDPNTGLQILVEDERLFPPDRTADASG